MYEWGEGMPQDKVLAYALYSNLLAAGDLSNNYDQRRNRKKLAEKMSPREIEAGRALTRELAQPGNFGKALDAYLKRAQAAKRKD
jgi:TPR repeat protein